jgi:hypothetical protein
MWILENLCHDRPFPRNIYKKFTEKGQENADFSLPICYNSFYCCAGSQMADTGKDVSLLLCPNCGQEISDQDTICPGCGQALEPAENPEILPETEDVAAEETAAETEDISEEIVEETEETTEEIPEETEETIAESEEATEETPAEEPAPEAPKAKKSPLAAILGAIIGLLVIIVVCLAVALTTLSKDGSISNPFASISEKIEKATFDSDGVALTLQDADGNDLEDITNAQLSYYFWGEYYYYVQSYGFYFDASLSLDEQNYSDDMTWQDYFLQSACTSIQQIYALKSEAEAAGFTMPEDYQAEYESTISSMADYAVSAGFTNDDGEGDVLAYIQDSYGSCATEETFEAYLYDSYYVTAYSDEIYNGLTFTDAEIDTYFDENEDMFTTYGIEKSNLPDVNVRHILVEPAEVETTEDEDSAQEAADEDAAWADALAEAQRILEEWQSGEATEDSFAELANTYSTDVGSNTNGGLYEDVYPGQMVSAFNDWCFDETRQPGDTDIVETSYGYHIMYFVGFTDTYYWKDAAESQLRYDTYSAQLDTMVSAYTIVTQDKLAILEPDAVLSIMAQYATDDEDTTDTADTDSAAE